METREGRGTNTILNGRIYIITLIKLCGRQENSLRS